MNKSGSQVPQEWLSGVLELFALYSELKADTDHFLTQLKGDFESQALRRSMIRALFGFVEGMSYASKRLVLAMEASREMPGKLSLQSDSDLARIAMLRGETYELDDKGRPVAKIAKIETVRTVLFAAAELAARLNRPDPIDKAGEDWPRFRSVLKVRHRLMHPKSAADLQVSDEELVDANKTYVWFHELYARLLRPST